METPTEHLHEHIHEGAEHGARWMTWVALSTAVLAVLAAIASLLANHNSDEAILSQIKASDSWNYYQAKGIKSQILTAGDKIVESMGKAASPDDIKKIASNAREQEKIKAEAEELEKESKTHVQIHQILSRAVTIFQIAIAISAITILTKRKELWYVSFVLAAVGTYFLVAGLLA